MPSSLLELQDVEVAFAIGKRKIPALQHISFEVKEKETVGIVGESGCGKSLTSLAVMGLLPEKAALTQGAVLLNGSRLNAGVGAEDGWRPVRGKQISMIFQNPMSALNPLIPVGKQIAEMAITHLGVTKPEAKRLALDMMGKVGLSRVDRLYDDYPHQLSGGMMQRIMIAMALLCSPKLLIADEPTTALDVSIQAQILDLLRELNRTTGTAILLISHDLGVIREVCRRVIVMYAGYVVEDAPVDTILDHPKHPYTIGLLQSLPGASKRGKPLYTIPGRVPALTERTSGCPFAGRCASAADICRRSAPELLETGGGHRVRCHLLADGRLEL